MTNYVCDLCGFASEDRATALAHVANVHGLKDPAEVGSLSYDARGRLVLRSGDGETVIDLDQWLGVTLASPEPARAPCSHPPERQYAWLARDDTTAGGQALCVACCDCGAILQGGAGLLDEAE